MASPRPFDAGAAAAGAGDVEETTRAFHLRDAGRRNPGGRGTSVVAKLQRFEELEISSPPPPPPGGGWRESEPRDER